MKKIFFQKKVFTIHRNFHPHILFGLHRYGPKNVDIELTNRCNLDCEICWFHGEKGVGDRYEQSELTSDEVFNLLNQLAKYHPRIYLGGSEPFVRRDILWILERIKKLGMSVSFTTNGTLLDTEKIKKLVDLSVDSVNFSIDGHEELHDQTRGRGTFKKVTQNIKEISEYKKKSMKKKPVLTANITITGKLMGHLENTFDAIKNSTADGVDFFRLHHLWYGTKKEITEHRVAVRRRLGCHAPGATSHLVTSAFIYDPSSLAHEMVSLRKRENVVMFPNFNHQDIVWYYSEDSVRKRRCLAPFLGTVIKPNGDVVFCPDEWIDDYVLGNVRNESFHEIWNNKKAQRFRSVLWQEKQFPGCKRCSWMYSF